MIPERGHPFRALPMSRSVSSLTKKNGRECLYPAGEARMSKTVVAPELWHVPRRTVSHASKNVRRTIAVTCCKRFSDPIILWRRAIMIRKFTKSFFCSSVQTLKYSWFVEPYLVFTKTYDSVTSKKIAGHKIVSEVICVTRSSRQINMKQLQARACNTLAFRALARSATH